MDAGYLINKILDKQKSLFNIEQAFLLHGSHLKEDLKLLFHIMQALSEQGRLVVSVKEDLKLLFHLASIKPRI